MGERKMWNINNGQRLLKKNNKSSNNLKKKKKNKTMTTQTLVVSSKPFRRARTKIKKPKFLSLSNTNNNDLQILSPPEDHQSRGGEIMDCELKLFPIHHQDDDPDPPESMADHIMFSEDGPGPTTLTGLLDGNGNGNGNGNGAVSSAASELSYAVVAQDSVNSARSLVRTAMRRSREREESEEKWVSISEVVERRTAAAAEVAEEEVTSGGGGLWLKLDYEEILNAWSAKGPFYVEADEEEEQPQIVPDLSFPQNGVVPFQGSFRNQGHWNVPEISLNAENMSNLHNKGEEGWKIGIREASVLRYKEKRQNRLFSKRIRYEVRKLNAEKRPRIKGRFVKRSV